MLVQVVIAVIIATLPNGRTETFDYPFKTVEDCRAFLSVAIPEMKTEHPKISLKGTCEEVQIDLAAQKGRGV